MNYILIIYTPTFPKKTCCFFTVISGTRISAPDTQDDLWPSSSGIFPVAAVPNIRKVCVYTVYIYIYVYKYICVCVCISMYIYIYYITLYVYIYIFKYVHLHLCIKNDGIVCSKWSIQYNIRSCLKQVLHNTMHKEYWKHMPLMPPSECLHTKSQFVRNKQRLLNMALYLSIIRTFRMIINAHNHGWSWMIHWKLYKTTYHSGKNNNIPSGELT